MLLVFNIHLFLHHWFDPQKIGARVIRLGRDFIALGKESGYVISDDSAPRMGSLSRVDLLALPLVILIIININIIYMYMYIIIIIINF